MANVKERMIEAACDAYCAVCDTKECVECGECDWVAKFRRQLVKQAKNIKED